MANATAIPQAREPYGGLARRYAGEALDRQGTRLMVQHSPIG
jgi:hypothetical protein